MSLSNIRSSLFKTFVNFNYTNVTVNNFSIIFFSFINTQFNNSFRYAFFSSSMKNIFITYYAMRLVYPNLFTIARTLKYCYRFY